MWPFTGKQTLKESGFFRGFTDWHSHILPGVDDGVQTMDETLQILAEYEWLGIREVWLTPHIMEDIPNTTARLRECFAGLQAAYTGRITLHLAAENMLDNLFEERLEKGDLLPIGNDKNCLLVETSYFNPPMGLYDILSRIKAKGYHPVLAHPERYMYMNEDDYIRLKSKGIHFQLNISSLFGLHGREAQEKAYSLLSRRMYDYAGSDLHKAAALTAILRGKSGKRTLGLLREVNGANGY